MSGNVHQLFIRGRVEQLVADEAGPGILLLDDVDGPGRNLKLNRELLSHGVVVRGEFPLKGVAGGQVRHRRRHDEGIVFYRTDGEPVVVVEHVLDIHDVNPVLLPEGFAGPGAVGKGRMLPLDNGYIIFFLGDEMLCRLESQAALEPVRDEFHGV